MANTYFSFKQFTVHQHLCAMKVGIDGVLLGAWASTENCSRILDIGSGTGLIALMLAQRSNSKIMAIDIEPNAIAQTKENIKISPWADRISALETSLQNFSIPVIQAYDLIVSNPPYFVNSLKAPEQTRTIARHTDSLTHNELLVHAKRLLAENGKICIILPVNEGLNCVKFASSIGLFCSKKVEVFPKPDKPLKRLLLEFILNEVETESSKIVIETTERHQYSVEFTKLVRDFYLHL